MQIVGQEPSQNTEDPFIIIHDYRTRKHEIHEITNKNKRHPHDYSQDRKSIILTRRMKADLEHKEDE